MTSFQVVDLDDRSYYVTGARSANFAYVDGRQPGRPACVITHPVDPGYFGAMLSDRGLEELIAMTKAFAESNGGRFVLCPADRRGGAVEVVFIANGSVAGARMRGAS